MIAGPAAANAQTLLDEGGVIAGQNAAGDWLVDLDGFRYVINGSGDGVPFKDRAALDGDMTAEFSPVMSTAHVHTQCPRGAYWSGDTQCPGAPRCPEGTYQTGDICSPLNVEIDTPIVTNPDPGNRAPATESLAPVFFAGVALALILRS